MSGNLRPASLATMMLVRLPFLLLAFAGAVAAHTHFEPRQQNPIGLTPDGKTLLALHSTAHSLSVFDVGDPARQTPMLVAEIPLSSAPVTVKARTDDEVWIANEAADSVSIVSLARRAIVTTLRVGDEPADICFANGKAFVSCSQQRALFVFDATTRAPLGQIAIDGVAPRALAASADGTKLYVASLLSGNRTTILHRELAPAQPAPTNPALPAAPKVALIVSSSDSRITAEVLDHDIAEINTEALTVERWFSDVGTNLFGLAIHPDGSLWCANSDSLNLTRFEPELNGEFARHRLTRVSLPSSALLHHELNPGIARATTPQPAIIATALAQPTAMVFNADGSRVWIAAFNSDRVAEMDTANGNILRRIDLRPPGTGPEGMRGPRALALGNNRLYVLNKLSDTLATIRPGDGAFLSEIPLGSIDPMPANIRAGRGLLYDARLSGNGTVSCATCHIDADRDGIAWDLGDPGGDMVDVISAPLSFHGTNLYTQSLHPMKGPLTTQTLRGLATNDAAPFDPTDGTPRPSEAVVTKFHWRGDKPSIQSFNSTFPNLMGGTVQPAESMDRLADYLESIIHHPNPNLNLDRSLRADHPKGDAVNGLAVFQNHALSHCIVCHGLPAGTDQNVDDFTLVELYQPMKNPALRTVYQRTGIYDQTGTSVSLSGFGLGSDGSSHELPAAHGYSSLSLLHNPPFTAGKIKALNDLSAFVLSFDTGTAPSACLDLTMTGANKSDAGLVGQLAILESRATIGDNGLVAWGIVNGMNRRFRWDPALGQYRSDTEASLTRSALLALLQTNDALTFSGVLPTETIWRSTDRNSNGIADTSEPMPVPSIERDGSSHFLRWPMGEWFPEASPDLRPPWLPAPGDPIPDGTEWKLPLPVDTVPEQFYRLRRTW